MLDVHPPHAPTHTWKDFFIHIATIVVGLIIAVGLEQTVEALHKARERTELRRALREESQEILNNCKVTRAVLANRDSTNALRMNELQTIVWKSKPLTLGSPRVGPSVLQRPDVPIWRTARTSGLAALLSLDEIQAYSEVEIVATKVEIAYDRMVVAHSNRVAFELEFPGPVSTLFSMAPPADIRQYLHLLSQEQLAIRYVDVLVAGMSGAESVILQNNFNVSQIRRSEQDQQSSHTL
jgi:hypothetical protein